MIYKRLFTFGCSYTSWHWPTWADILGREFGDENYKNLGICASGNEFAFHRLTEAHARFNIQPDDLVIICWTNFAREDRYLNGGWQTTGNIFDQDFYPKEWVEKWFDLRGALVKTASFIAGATHLLDSIGCDYVYGSAFPMQQMNQRDTLFTGPEFEDIFRVYDRYFQKINRSMTQHLYGDGVWKNPEGLRIRFWIKETGSWIDDHPNVQQHLRYLQDIILPKIRDPIKLADSTIDWANEWHAKTLQDEVFNCERDGLTFVQRWQKYHQRML